MLTRIIILNSEKHAKVIIKLDDATAIQVIGANKIGKTMLINSLNFLYIIDKNKMSFDSKAGKSTYDYKESLHHFFPNVNQSFLIFECFKANASGYFYILVKRKLIEEDVEYFRINKKFDEKDFYLENSNATLTLKNFDDIRKQFTIINAIESLKKSDYFQWVYNKDKSKNTFLWINKEVKRKGQALENSLTKMYHYLLNASAINDNALMEALIIADNREETALEVFSNKSKLDTIERLKKDHEHIRKISNIEKEFEAFRLIVDITQNKRSLVNQFWYSFKEVLKQENERINLEIKQTQKSIDANKEEYAIFEPKQTKISEKIGGIKGNIKLLKNDKNPIQGKIYKFEEEIKSINQLMHSINFTYKSAEQIIDLLKSQKESLQKQLDEINFSLQSIKQYKIEEKEVIKKITTFKKQKEQTITKIAKYENLLIHNISGSVEIKEKLNALFSDKFLSIFSKDDIDSKIDSLSSILTINEGKIKNMEKIGFKRLESTIDLEESIISLEKDIEQQRDILETIQNRTSKEQEKNDLEEKIKKIQDKIEKISQKKQFEKDLEKAIKELQELEDDLKKRQTELNKVSEELKKINALILKDDERINGLNRKKEKYKDWYNEFLEKFKDFSITETTLLEANLETLRERLQKAEREWGENKQELRSKFSNLQKQSDNYEADVSIFIKQTEQEISTIDNKKKSLETLLEQISNEFTAPIINFLDAYNHFKGFVKKFNSNINKYKISGFKSLKIEIDTNDSLFNDLEKISKIIKVTDFDSDLFNSFEDKEQQEYLKVLEKYITNRNSSINFKELFSLSVWADDGEEKIKRINLKVGNESNGTIRMINLILFLLLINYFKQNNTENKLVFFIDEDVIDPSNTEQLIQFCKDNNFIILFAAKHQIVGLEKYYFITKSTKNKKVLVDERNVEFAEKI